MHAHFISSFSGIEIYHLCLAYEDSLVSFIIEKYPFTCLRVWTLLEIKSSDENTEHSEFSWYLVEVC